MRAWIAATVVVATGVAAHAQTAPNGMAPAEATEHSLRGLLTMYAAGTVCFYDKMSFSKQDTDEMLGRIKQLEGQVPKATRDAMWSDARQIMSEGQANANAERCAAVRGQYEKGRPFLLGPSPTR